MLDVISGNPTTNNCDYNIKNASSSASEVSIYNRLQLPLRAPDITFQKSN